MVETLRVPLAARGATRVEAQRAGGLGWCGTGADARTFQRPADQRCAPTLPPTPGEEEGGEGCGSGRDFRRKGGDYVAGPRFQTRAQNSG